MMLPFAVYCVADVGLLSQSLHAAFSVRAASHAVSMLICRFMKDYDSRLDLAPRDIVARAIHEQMQSRGESHVLLDISYQPREKILQHFPNIAEQCAGYGLDITRDPIPVAPAQHYMCGGVKVCACH